MQSKMYLWNIKKLEKQIFEKCDLDIWPWHQQLTMTLVQMKKSYIEQYILCEIWKLYHLPLKSNGKY